MMKTMGNIQRDKESSLFHEMFCWCEAGVAAAILVWTVPVPRLFVALNDEVGGSL